MVVLMDGKHLSQKKQTQLKEQIAQMKAETGCVPGLVVILVGENPASQVYVRNKERAANLVGIHSETIRLEETVSEAVILELIESYNQNDQFHGILVQLPLPDHIDERRILHAIRPEKDVDSFHPTNMGYLWSGQRVMVPCTPAGIMELLSEYNIPIAGKNAVVIGRSNIVGKPMAQLLLEEDATVTLTHSRTENLASVARKADILVVAIGQSQFVTADFVKEGAVVIDVGVNRGQDGKLVGDVDFQAVKERAGYLTPVPGGVGPMTITMLMEQTYQAALRTQQA
ncbi:bifunctional methylenetetrahydrofolate dehydrogenase/methenyltetrahydrofolate cyclohydrolase [Streptococcus sp. DD13]|uniref:bifunctional methylenetetrahydrofolate dehydrogenase/methenyltetrahydrofolate cyclohydrolase n=1 Tax=Streptococcus sp. DD13 TaxID=1777881 RepID=UPI00079370CF|nr:bifunctional methylenetetrahydrofolate dehydrogenase/methenyltetrahydrofolate cyclohydrolase [Streptococcus sp. DD13]KXT79244.1 Methylenetetrahydrofolate dehydrogenase (NADP+) / Methenyltetrahydrofolate cyclohydrolase [Streptococcus sp. DD13]